MNSSDLMVTIFLSVLVVSGAAVSILTSYFENKYRDKDEN